VPEAADPMPVEYVMHILSESLPERVAIFDESISSMAKLHRYVRVNHPGGYHLAVSGGLGFAMPGSVGFKLGAPERPVACVIGDGSSMYSIQALWTAARYGVGVAFFVINNRGYSILKGFREAIGVGDKVPGLDVHGVEIVQIARGFGVEGELVERAEDLRPAIERALSAGRPYLLDVIVDRKVPELLG
jgi:benzoylformate decarboxylase